MKVRIVSSEYAKDLASVDANQMLRSPSLMIFNLAYSSTFFSLFYLSPSSRLAVSHSVYPSAAALC